MLTGSISKPSGGDHLRFTRAFLSQSAYWAPTVGQPLCRTLEKTGTTLTFTCEVGVQKDSKKRKLGRQGEESLTFPPLGGSAVRLTEEWLWPRGLLHTPIPLCSGLLKKPPLDTRNDPREMGNSGVRGGPSEAQRVWGLWHRSWGEGSWGPASPQTSSSISVSPSLVTRATSGIPGPTLGTHTAAMLPSP